MGEVHMHPSVERVDLLAAWALPAGDAAPIRAVASLVGGSPLLDAVAAGGWLGGVPLVWFEWDDVGGRPRPPLEFVCVSDDILGDRAARRPPRSPGWAGEVVAWCGEAAVGEAARVVGALGDAGALMHVCTLAPRGLDRVRLGFRVRADEVAGWLRRLDWPGDLAAVAALLTRDGLAGQAVGIQLDLAPALGGYLGVELPELRRGEADREVADAQLAAAATVSALDQGRAALFRGWSGWDEAALRHTHLKLATVDGAWIAKAYLGRTAAAIANDMRLWGASRSRGRLLGG
jgi:hypothetical protein